VSPAGQRVLAVDFGDRRTGLAATAGSTRVVVPLPALHGLDDAACAAAIAALARERASDVVVVGLPLDARGKVGPRAARTLQFVEVLAAAAPCPVVTIDETFSTDEAHERLKRVGMRAAQRRSVADSIAALVIAERYLASQGRTRPERGPDPDAPEPAAPDSGEPDPETFGP